MPDAITVVPVKDASGNAIYAAPGEALNLRRQVECEQKASAVSLLMTRVFECISRWPRQSLLAAGFGALIWASWPGQKKRSPKRTAARRKIRKSN
jgi:hypothetical protein